MTKIFFLLTFLDLSSSSVSIIQDPKSLPAVISLIISYGEDGCRSVVFNKNDLRIKFLNAALVLINSCTIEQLHDIPVNISKKLVIELQEIWKAVRGMMLCGGPRKCDQKGHFYPSKIRTNDLAESIFRLSIDGAQHNGLSNVSEIKGNIFPLEGIDFEDFVLNYWEATPLHVRDSFKASLVLDNMFSPFTRTFRTEDVVSFFPSVLKNLTSCPQIFSDEQNVLHFLERVKNTFGCPIIYHEDIRVVKTDNTKDELHYFLDNKSGTSNTVISWVLRFNEVLRCQQALDEGYTIALRGIEFRFESIAAIADEFASLFGQPSAGVNLYLTPPNSQGLSCHTDDHCVFVWQLVGVKEWTLFPRLSSQLPRLYEDGANTGVQKKALAGSQQFLLKEGDILYIPRGVPHEARTITDEDGSAGFSLHLTLAIEVELPFE